MSITHSVSFSDFSKLTVDQMEKSTTPDAWNEGDMRTRNFSMATSHESCSFFESNMSEGKRLLW